VLGELLHIAGLTASPGQKVSEHVSVSVAGIQVRVPLFLINGAHPGPTLVVTAGIHGAEYASIEAALRLGRTLDAGVLRGRVIIAPIANPPAFTARSIYVSPPDGKNLNRQFPGQARGTFSQSLAYWLFEEVIRRADAFVDLHGGDLIEALEPFVIYFHTGDSHVDQVSAELARSFGIHYVIDGDTPGSTYGAAAQAGIPGLLAEAGGQGIWTEETANLLHTGVLRIMAHLGMTDALPAPVEPPVMLQRWEWLNSTADGFFYPKIKVGDYVHAGQDLGCVADVSGAALQAVKAPIDGTVLFLVTALAMNSGDPLVAIAA
jgi:predicted deacylase